ncbi:MAG: hypothetical protein ACETWQ_05115 [Phycisphaerae bacterium]
MIKTLRVTSIAAAVSAVIFLVFFVFPVVFGVHSDEQLEESLNSPGVIEKFNKTMGNKAKTGQDEVSPLVQQAGAFALYLNPPPAKTPRTATGRTAGITRGPAAPPKFKVIGTSYYKDRPELSMALIDEPGKGLRWFRQSSEVGHFLIEQVKDGIVVFKDGKGTFEQQAEQKPELSLLEGDSAASSQTGASGRTDVSSQTSVSSRARSEAGSKAILPASRKAGTSIAGAISKAPRPRGSAEEAEFQELVERLRQIQRSFKSDKAGSGPSAKEKAEMMEKVISEFKSSRLSTEEAERLSILGKELKKVLEGPESTGPEENRDN